ncbi:MAG: Short-chain dehydrogenase/reductase SDR [Candidatus Gottesmanbacteria bacterium GW2011_GWA1_44_24b]|uniref:Short-chain dehydrogenase/reductase SDR n=1 Tax=Candidatus Gottesmanbacteria bacterium GW2011_GWA1_44_24b TaxID=1618437 RepID=A0A0G1IIF3_9BACT|nr:MAG: Short-chain dehydrogenase/reductase SDR [Candidatus Gottesmanbacteria bacterium GW2011_GWA1_44_24b]HCM81844.1 short-chain dehydrogenase [Patescibacteria group bacterium]
MFDLTNKVALITGASSGIGRASAIALAGQGASVAIAARRVEKLEELKKEIEGKGGKALVIPMDVTKKEDIEAGVKKIVETFGRLDILLNNAGVAEFASFFDMTDEQWDKTLNTNLKAYFHVAQAAGQEMAKNKWGRIINISSIASGGVAVGFPQVVHYCASKGGIVGMTEALADELAPLGITVNAIGPGVIETEMTQGITGDPQQSQGMLARIPMKRFGKPEEIASAVVYLASDEASYTTGATLYIDGGWTAS